MEKRPVHLMAKPIGPLCNIRCEYCFYLSKTAMYPDKKNRADFSMTEEVLETYIRKYVEAQPDTIREITFAWQGGEPTLLPQSFYEKALELEKKYVPRGVTIQNAFQTNGILIDRSRAEWFAENGFLIGISIDGPEDLHNRYRKDRAGKGTFADVMAGLENLKAAGAEVNTLTVVQESNGDHPGRVYDFLKSIGSKFMQFIPIVEKLPGGGASERSVSAEQWGGFMNGVFDRWVRSDIGEIYVQHFDMMLGLHMGYPSSLCTHGETCGNAMAIEHDGTVYSCDHFVFPENRLGNVMDDDIMDIVNNPIQLKFGADKRDALPDKCRQCKWLKFCWGACPKDRIIDSPGGSGKLNWVCDGWYAFYEHTELHFRAMAAALRARMPASEFRRFFHVDESRRPGRNDPCPCLSGRKFKNCHGAMPSV